MTLEETCSEVRNFIAIADSKTQSFETLAWKVFTFQYEQNPPYRAFCKARRASPETVTSVDQIPAMVTSGFKELTVSVLPENLRTTVFYSSGTTRDTPSRHYHSAESLAVYEQSLLRWFEPHLLSDKPRANFLVLAPHRSAAPHSSLAHMFEAVTSQYAESSTFAAALASDGSWMLEHEKILNTVSAYAKTNLPIVLCGTAFSFVHLCDYLEEQGRALTFPNGSRVFETGGYKGRSRFVSKTNLHRLITERLSIPPTHIVSEYGMSELSSQAYDRTFGGSKDRVFYFPPWARASVVSPETGEQVLDGETGLVRVVDLANIGSVLAVQTEDLARRRGSGFELMGRAVAAAPRGCSLMQVS